jgi:hypothetical protein
VIVKGRRIVTPHERRRRQRLVEDDRYAGSGRRHVALDDGEAEARIGTSCIGDV